MVPVRPFLRRLWRDEGGATTIEFVAIFPALMYFFFALGEIGTLMGRQVMIERGVDIAVRDLRLGLASGITHDQLKERICQGAFLLSSCDDVLRLELAPLAAGGAATFAGGGLDCVDRPQPIHPLVGFNPGAGAQIVVVRACLMADPIFPGSAFAAMMPRDASGAYAIVITSAFMNEAG